MLHSLVFILFSFADVGATIGRLRRAMHAPTLKLTKCFFTCLNVVQGVLTVLFLLLLV